MIGILLLSALLVTPAHKHAIVNAMIVAALLRSLSAVVPMFAYEALSEQFDNIQQHPSLSRFCGTFGILYVDSLNLLPILLKISHQPSLPNCCKGCICSQLHPRKWTLMYKVPYNTDRVRSLYYTLR